MKLIIAFAVIAVAVALPLGQQYTTEEYAGLFKTWMVKHEKTYSDEEYPRRLAAFTDNVDFVSKHMAEYQLGLHTYTVALNKFADLTSAEFKAFYLGYAYQGQRNTTETAVLLDTANMPDSVDWRTKGAVTPVKNQQQCGSCWAFSTTGGLEGANFVKNGKLVSLSEQELVDCDKGDSGCGGGLMDNAFKWIKSNGGLDTEEDYPYTAKDGRCNKQKEAKHVVDLTGWTDVPQDNEDQLAAAVAKQPVSIAIEADQSGFQMYSGGVFSGKCGTQLDHGVLAVGYGTEGSQKYWIVKNSWGASWGDQGYIKLVRGTKGPKGQCGIAMQPSYPQAA